MIHTLQADSIELSFGGRKILSDIFLTCQTAEIVGLLGRNGSGKSCLMRIILGNLKSSNSYVAFDGIKVSDAFKKPHLILLMPQFNFIPKGLKIIQVFNDFQLSYESFEKLFPATGMRPESKVYSLSGGQRRILEIYVIVKSKTLFVMLDEPFTHLNPLQIENVKKFLLQEKAKKGIIISDHMYEHVLSITIRTYVLSQGKTFSVTDRSDLFHLGYTPNRLN